MRFDFNWGTIEQSRGSFNWSRYDAVVSAARSRGLKILGILTYSPGWASGSSDGHSPPSNVGDFANFARATVARYGPQGVKHWEIWNEPNHKGFWKPCPDVAKYTSLLKAAYSAIKSADPGAVVVTGGMSPASDDGCMISPISFLRGIYAAGGKGSFDAVGHHPYSFPALPGDALGWSAWYQMYGTSPSLRSLMEANGDGSKQIWMTEWGAKIGAVSEQAQADTITRGYDLIRSYSWAGPLFAYTYRDYDSFGLVRSDWSPRPAWYAYRNAPR